jgi:hypothetical protein
MFVPSRKKAIETKSRNNIPQIDPRRSSIDERLHKDALFLLSIQSLIHNRICTRRRERSAWNELTWRTIWVSLNRQNPNRVSPPFSRLVEMMVGHPVCRSSVVDHWLILVAGSEEANASFSIDAGQRTHETLKTTMLQIWNSCFDRIVKSYE